MAHEAFDALDSLVTVERSFTFVVMAGGFDLILHIRPEELRTHFAVHFYDKDEFTD